jgi:hypothetical protein
MPNDSMEIPVETGFDFAEAPFPSRSATAAYVCLLDAPNRSARHPLDNRTKEECKIQRWAWQYPKALWIHVMPHIDDKSISHVLASI